MQENRNHTPYGIYEKYIKRCFDIFLSIIAFICLLWLFLIIAFLVRINLGSPIIFKQERVGKNGEIFKMYKFRTMLAPQTRDGKKISDKERLTCIEKGVAILSDEERLTKFGRFLRASSLDELPELINVINGTMSIVGPRPLATIYLPFYTEKEMKRHNVRPGITGMAQIHGRNTSSWTTRFKYDVDYVNHVTFWTDMKIVLSTVAVVFSHQDIGQGTEKPEAFSIQRQLEQKKKR